MSVYLAVRQSRHIPRHVHMDTTRTGMPGTPRTNPWGCSPPKPPSAPEISLGSPAKLVSTPAPPNLQTCTNSIWLLQAHVLGCLPTHCLLEESLADQAGSRRGQRLVRERVWIRGKQIDTCLELRGCPSVWVKQPSPPGQRTRQGRLLWRCPVPCRRRRRHWGRNCNHSAQQCHRLPPQAYIMAAHWDGEHGVGAWHKPNRGTQLPSKPQYPAPHGALLRGSTPN